MCNGSPVCGSSRLVAPCPCSWSATAAALLHCLDEMTVKPKLRIGRWRLAAELQPTCTNSPLRKQFHYFLIKPSNTNSSSSNLEVLGMRPRSPMQSFFHDKIRVITHSDPPKVFFVKRISANYTLQYLQLSSILRHFSLHTCYLKRLISRPKHALT